ncbi:Crp/Fnr family transcriptional regulator [Candidatus Gottesmanbacteria bacterium]|nr:Crp/Fnr family transcriptional regulator [Candidatus Gottesmanbacteria bacterium]
MMWVLNDTPNNYYFEAAAASTVFIAPKEKVVAFVKNEPEVLYDLTQRLYKGIDGLLKRMEYLMSGDAFRKLVIILLISKQRFSFSDKKSTISIKLTHKDLASQAGISRETVSREMKKLEKKGVISYYKNYITIRNLEKLEHEFFAEPRV